MAMRRSFGSGGMKASKPVSFNSGGGGNSLLNMMMAQQMLGPKLEATSKAKLAESEEQTSTAGQGLESLVGQMKKATGNKPPINAKVSVGPSGGSMDLNLNEKYTIDEARNLGHSDSISNSIGYIVNDMKDPVFRERAKRATTRLFNEKPGNIGPISTTGPFSEMLGFGPQDMKAGILKDHLNNIQNRVVRLQSGAQINMQEFDRIVQQLPTWEDFTDESDPTFERAKRKLANFAREMNGMKERVLSGRMVDDQGNKVVYDPAQWGEDINKFIQIPSVETQTGIDNQVGTNPQPKISAPVTNPVNPTPMAPKAQESAPIDDEERFWQEYKKANP